jgi:hypothetical protein
VWHSCGVILHKKNKNELFIFPIIEVMKLVSILNKVFHKYLPLIFATWILKHLDWIHPFQKWICQKPIVLKLKKNKRPNLKGFFNPLKNLLTTQVKLEQTRLEVIKMVIMVNNYGYQKLKKLVLIYLPSLNFNFSPLYYWSQFNKLRNLKRPNLYVSRLCRFTLKNLKRYKQPIYEL